MQYRFEILTKEKKQFNTQNQSTRCTCKAHILTCTGCWVFA